MGEPQRLREILRREKLKRDTSAEPTVRSSDTEGKDSCLVCRGGGFIYPEVEFGHPDFGKAIPCKCTLEEFQANQRLWLEKYSQLGPLTKFTFENFDPKRGQFLVGNAYQSSRQFALAPQGFLVLIGPSGCGKTHLAAAIANEQICQGKPALFIAVADLLDHLRSTYNPESPVSYDELFHQVRSSPLLILDDLSTYTATPWAKEKLFQLINHRYSFRLPTVFTLRPPLERLEETLRTRLTDEAVSCVCIIERVQADRFTQVLDLPLYRNMTFQNWSSRPNLSKEDRENLAQAYEQAKKFAHKPQGWLVFLGETGCGKTHLAAAIAHYRQGLGEPVLFTSVSDLLDYLRQTFSPESREAFSEVFERVKKAPLLILDDFGEHPSTLWAWQKLYHLIEYRHAAQLPTVITSRHTLEVMEDLAMRYPELPLLPIISRMSDPILSLVYYITAPDYRIDHPRGRSF